MRELLPAAVIWLGAYGAAAAAWPVLRLNARARALAIFPIVLITFVLSLCAANQPVWLRIILAMSCPLFGIKLVDAHLHANYWRRLRIAEWLTYLPNAFVIVH